MPGVTVTLKTCSGDAVATTVSDAAGSFVFNNIAPGCFRAEFSTVPPGLIPTRQNVGDDLTDSDINPFGQASDFVVAPGASEVIGAGFVQPASVGKFVWLDSNNNGVQDADEKGLTGVVVTLLEGSTPVAMTVSSEGGFYSFTNLIPGSAYSLRFDTPTGFGVSPQNAGADDDLDSDIGIVSGETAVFALSQGTNKLDVAAGLTGSPSTLGQFVWNDVNGNGLQDSGEPGLGGVQVTLVTATGVVVATQTTNEAGYFLFENVAPGSYYVKFATPPVSADGVNMVPTTEQVGGGTNLGSDSDIDSTGSTGLIMVVSGTNDTSIGAGFVVPQGSNRYLI